MSSVIIEYEHKLSKKESSALKDHLLEQLNDHDLAVDIKSELIKKQTEQIKALNIEILETRDSLRTGNQTRAVRCDRVVDAEAGKIYFNDIFTGETRSTVLMDGDPFDTQLDLGIGDEAEYIRIISVESLPKKFKDDVGCIFKLDSRQKEGKDRCCYFTDSSGTKRKIPLIHVEIYNWAEVEELENFELIDSSAAGEVVEND